MRHLPPIFSPVGFGAIAGSTVARDGADRDALSTLLRDRFDAESVELTGSGTQALQLALSTFRREGAVVALPAYSCFDLVSAAVGAGVGLRFYDVRPDDLTPDLDSLETCLAAGADALVVGNLYGYPIPWADVTKLARRHGVGLIEDAAQGIGAEGGGTAGDFTVLSFGRGKGWTGGGGGALLMRRGATAKPPLGEPAGRTKSALTSFAAWLLGRPRLYHLPASIPQLGLGTTQYHEPVAPAPISSFSASLALRTSTPAATAIPARRRVAREWLAAFAGADPDRRAVAPCLPGGGVDASSALRLAVLAPTLAGSDPRWPSLRRLGVESGYPGALPSLGAARPLLGPEQVPCPGATRLGSQLVTLPTHQWVRSSDIEAVVSIMTGAQAVE